MFKVTVRNALNLETLWTKVFGDENSAENYAEVYFDPEGAKGFGKCLTATWEKI